MARSRRSPPAFVSHVSGCFSHCCDNTGDLTPPPPQPSVTGPHCSLSVCETVPKSPFVHHLSLRAACFPAKKPPDGEESVSSRISRGSINATDTSCAEWRCSLELLANDVRGLSLESPRIAVHSASPFSHVILHCLCLQLIQLSVLPQLPPATSSRTQRSGHR